MGRRAEKGAVCPSGADRELLDPVEAGWSSCFWGQNTYMQICKCICIDEYDI